MYARILEKNSNSFLSNSMRGIGYLNGQLYICYDDDYLTSWATDWEIDCTPETFGYKKLPKDFHFNHFIDFKTRIIK